MKAIAILVLALALGVAESALAGYVVDVTFSGDTNDICSVEIENGTGKKDFDAFLVIPESEKIGLCEQIVVTNFARDNQKATLSIEATSSELNGFKAADLNGRKQKFPIIRTKQFSFSSLTVFLNAWLPIGGVQQQDGSGNAAMIRVRHEASNKSVQTTK